MAWFTVFRSRRMAVLFLLGFSSGLAGAMAAATFVAFLMSVCSLAVSWIASGSDTVARGSREFRQLVKAGIDLVGRHLSLPRRA